MNPTDINRDTMKAMDAELRATDPNPPQSETPLSVDQFIAHRPIITGKQWIEYAKALEARATEAERRLAEIDKQAAIEVHGLAGIVYSRLVAEQGTLSFERFEELCEYAFGHVHAYLRIKLADAVRERDEWKQVAMTPNSRRLKEALETLQFVERMANHHGQKIVGGKLMIPPEDTLSLIQHHPNIEAITKGYSDGKVPETPNPWEKLTQAEQARDAALAEVEALKAQAQIDEREVAKAREQRDKAQEDAGAAEKALADSKAIAREAVACRNDAADEVERLRGEIAGMRDLLRERCFWTANDSKYDRQGYSCNIGEDTALRDINYRNAKLWPTADEAIDAALAETMEHNAQPPEGAA